MRLQLALSAMCDNFLKFDVRTDDAVGWKLRHETSRLARMAAILE